MQHRSDATTATDFSAESPKAERASRFVQRAPGPELPEVRDRAGARSGMAIVLIGGGLFWLIAAAAVAVWLQS